MKRTLFTFLFLSSLLLTACFAQPASTDLLSELERIENALPEEYEKQSVTEVYDFTFSDSEHNTMIYYICHTTYYSADPSSVTGLNTEAIGAVLDTDIAVLQMESEISGYPAVIYLLENRQYLCCTVSPENTLILEYSPDSISEEDAVKTMRSVFETVEP